MTYDHSAGQRQASGPPDHKEYESVSDRHSKQPNEEDYPDRLQARLWSRAPNGAD